MAGSGAETRRECIKILYTFIRYYSVKFILLIGFCALLGACSPGSKTYHTVSVRKPIYHHTWYKKSRWHKKQLGPLRVDLHPFGDKQGAKKVKMKG